MGREGGKAPGKSHPVLPALGADNDPDALCPRAFSMTANRLRRRASPLTSCAVPASGSSAMTRASVERAMPIGWKSPVPTKRISSASALLCRGKTAAEHLSPVGRPAPSLGNPDINAPFFQERFHRGDEMDVLDGGDEPGGLSFEEREGIFQHCDIEVNLVWHEDDPVLRVDRCMARHGRAHRHGQGYRAQGRRHRSRDRR